MASVAELTEPRREILASRDAGVAVFSPALRHPLSEYTGHLSWRLADEPEAIGSQLRVLVESDRPRWLNPLMRGLEIVLALPPGWDSYGAPAIRLASAEAALQFAASYLRANCPAPSVVPLSSGGVQLEWNRPGAQIEVAFEPSEPTLFSVTDITTGADDGEIPRDQAKLRKYLEGLD